MLPHLGINKKSKMKNIYLVLIIIFFSCASKKDLTIIKYNGYSNSKKQNYSYKINIKKGFKIKEIHGGNEWIQKEYIYVDNSTFYISNEDGNTSLNYNNIRNDKFQSDKSIMAFSSNDTITLQGIDKNGKYWKNKYDGEVNIGYLNIPKEKKEEFDKIISSVIIK
jgi:hypothetical protein